MTCQCTVLILNVYLSVWSPINPLHSSKVQKHPVNADDKSNAIIMFILYIPVYLIYSKPNLFCLTEEISPFFIPV